MTAPLTTQPDVAEPFGQRGVRQYLFPALTCSSLIMMVLSIGMWIRSHHVVDAFRRERSGIATYVSSIYGRILIAWGNDSPFRAGEEWTYYKERMPDQINDRWQPSIYKTLGIEWRRKPLNDEWGTTGGWVRIRWPLVVAIAGLLPLARVIRERKIRNSNTEVRNKSE